MVKYSQMSQESCGRCVFSHIVLSIHVFPPANLSFEILLFFLGFPWKIANFINFISAGKAWEPVINVIEGNSGLLQPVTD